MKRSIANSDPQSGRIFGIRGKSADLPWTLYIVGTLTNNANIIIQYYLVPYRLSTDSKTRDFE